MDLLRAELDQGLNDLGLHLDLQQTAHLLSYLQLIQKWTTVYNLTALHDLTQMLRYHLLDSLAVIAPLNAQLVDIPRRGAGLRLLDVGSGAGLPGVVIAICCPELVVHCVDAVAKKAAFIQQVALSLRLPNLRGIHARVESLTEQYQIITSRAFASLQDFTARSRGPLAQHGIWMAMKGKLPSNEIAALPESVEVFHVEQLIVPQLVAERCIVWMRLLALSDADAPLLAHDK